MTSTIASDSTAWSGFDRMRLGRCLLAGVLVVGLLSGCIIVPIPRAGHTGEFKTIDEGTAQFIQTGVTTREEVLLRLGAPSTSEEEDTLLRYEVEEYGWAFLILAYQSVPLWVSGTRVRFLILEFNEQGVVKAWRFDEWAYPRRKGRELSPLPPNPSGSAYVYRFSTPIGGRLVHSQPYPTFEECERARTQSGVISKCWKKLDRGVDAPAPKE